MKPVVSIIIPAYNAAKYIRETIDSICKQSLSEWELWIIDDGSSDQTAEIVDTYTNDSRIHLISKKNEGVSIARNVGFQQATGEYVAFLDADDVWLEPRLEKMVALFRTRPSLGLVHSHMQVIDEHSQLQETIYKGKEGFILDSLLLWEECNIPAPSSILVKREVVDQVGGFSDKLSTAADQEFFFRVAAQYEIGMVPEVLGLYRIHGENMHSNIQRMEEDHLRAYQLAEENKLFKSRAFREKCYANLYWILGGSWWVNGRNKKRGALFLFRALIKNPKLIGKLAQKLV